MARIALTQAGAALGRRVLPQSFQLLGRRFSGASIGRRLGGLAADALETALTPPRDGPRLDALQVMESREGAGIFNVYGRARVAGHLIWAGDFTEKRETQGGKGGPRVNTYSYSVSFAVGICEGPGARIERIWANGELLETGRYVHRVYAGTEDQVPDPAIEAALGAGGAPAYRGLCYIVFEDFPLEAFGNRLPNLSFEVVRTPAGNPETGLSNHVNAVNMIPATGEFVYATQPVHVRTFPGRETPLNVHSADGRADFLVSLDQLQAELPNVEAVSLTVGWFGSNLRAADCEVRPGVETLDRDTVPLIWRAGDVSRSSAHLISEDAQGNANYGGTPSDETVIQAMREMSMRGIEVTLTPFLLMDIPPDNTEGQPPFPWRGRITSASSGTASAQGDVQAFMGGASRDDFSISGDRVIYSGSSGDWGYRRFILHLAWVAKASGVCSAFLIGSEMRDLTRVRDHAGSFPFVDALVALAADVKAILGPACSVSYAADWSEYGAYQTHDGTGDVFFPLDELWASSDVDFVGIDWYPPAGDWRDGESHSDRLAGYPTPGDQAYIFANQTGGEGYDWYYASSADRDDQVRTPIIDTAHGEDWVFRPKDLHAWWDTAHHERPGGVRAIEPTPWMPGSKPIRFSEIGFPAVDKGTNAPNLFFDPKSSESAIPPYSTGQRDDILQAQALTGALGYWQAQPMIEKAVVWAWDARPYPAFPSRSDAWSDGDNWSYGHWLNGRTGLSPLAQVLDDLSDRAGVALDTSLVVGLTEGVAYQGVLGLDDAVEPLALAYDLLVTERGDGLSIWPNVARDGPAFDVSKLVEDPKQTRRIERGLVGRLHLSHAGLLNGYQIEVTEARDGEGDLRNALSVELPMVFSAPEAQRVAARLLEQSRRVTSCEITMSGLSDGISVGSAVAIENEDWVVSGVQRGLEDTLLLQPRTTAQAPLISISSPNSERMGISALQPDLLIIDGLLIDSASSPTLGVAVYADPWSGPVQISAGLDANDLVERAVVESPSNTGRLLTPLAPGPVHRWDEATTFEAEFALSELSSAEADRVLSGQNTLLVETAAGWECLSFRNAELIGKSTYRLSGFLRGLKGTESCALIGASIGARCVLFDEAIGTVALSQEEVGQTLTWRAGSNGAPFESVFLNRATWPLSPAHAIWDQSGKRVTWLPRDRRISTNWEVPDPVLDLAYEVEWRMGDGSAEVTQHLEPEATQPEGAEPVRLRSVNRDGWPSDWVSIRPQ